MFRSHSLFRAFGIPIRVHGTLLVFLPLLAFMATGGFQGLPAFLFGLVLVVLLFGCVLLHELGHSVVALAYGVPVRQITLYPIGGVAGLGHMPREPKKEFLITLAGPLVNFFLAGLLWFTLAAVKSFAPAMLADLLLALCVVNLGLGIFNLLPGFPMDGGRLLRAALASRLSYSRATRIAVRVGQGTAILLGITALVFFRPMLAVIAGFIFFAAEAELRMTTGGGQGPRTRRPGAPLPDVRQPRTPRREGETFIIRESPRTAGNARGTVIEIHPDGTVRQRPWTD